MIPGNQGNIINNDEVRGEILQRLTLFLMYFIFFIFQELFRMCLGTVRDFILRGINQFSAMKNLTFTQHLLEKKMKMKCINALYRGERKS